MWKKMMVLQQYILPLIPFNFHIERYLLFPSPMRGIEPLKLWIFIVMLCSVSEVNYINAAMPPEQLVFTAAV